MRNIKNTLSVILRKTGLLYTADYLKYYFQKILNKQRNKLFKKQNTAFVLPPDYFLYETFTLDYREYMNQGSTNAKELIDAISQYTDLSIPGKRILDWGCGPARVVRHLPELLHHDHFIYGSDYNRSYIDWCSTYLKGISFSVNDLNPPLFFDEQYFDVIYSISILTHLSEKNHYDWIREIGRILKPGGILIITTQGTAYRDKMLIGELIEFNRGNLVTRNYEKEGHRIFSAFQPEAFMRQLFKDFEILTVQSGEAGNSIHGKQDTWIVRKK